MIDELKTPLDFIEDLINAIEKKRIESKLTQKELCKVSGVALSTYQKFLYKKNINLIALVKVMYSLDMIENLKSFSKYQQPKSLEELKQKSKLPKRVRNAKS